MKHYILFNVTTCYYVIVSISKEVNPLLIGLNSDWIIHGPHNDYAAAEIQFNRVVTFQNDFK